MSLGDAYTLGIKVAADISGLQQALAQGQAAINEFASGAANAMNVAAAAMNRAASVMEGSVSKTRRSTQQQTQDTRKAGDGFEDYMRRATRAQEQVAQSSESTSRRTTTALGGVGSTVARLTGYAGFAMLAKQVWDAGLGFHEFSQNAEVSLRVLLGSEQAAKSMLSSILEFARTTPYAFPDLTRQAQQLLSYGFAAEDLIPTLRAAGDAATGMGRGMEGVERITRALGQIGAKGRLQSQELMQLSEVGVNGLRILANQAGVTTGEYQKLVEQGLVPADVAISGLVSGIREGTDGINGQTQAFGGMMAQIKGAGGITATMDGARTAFRNASAALTSSLLPAFGSLMQTAIGGLGAIESVGKGFEALPGPLRQAALSMGAALLAMRLLNGEARLTGLWSGMRTAWRVAGEEASWAASQTGRMGVAMRTAGAHAVAMGGSLKAAFVGNPATLAVMALTTAMGALAANSAAAEARADSYADAVKLMGDEAMIAAEKVATAAFIDGTDDWGWFQRQRTGYETVADAIEGMGLSVAGAGKAVAGSEAEFDAYIAMLRELRGGEEDSGSRQWRTYSEIIAKVEQQREAYGRQRHEQEQLTAATEEGTEANQRAAGAWDATTQGVRQWSEEQRKAIDASGEAAQKAMDTATRLMSVNLGLTTAEDVAEAMRGVDDAARGVRDAEERLGETRGRENVTALDIVRSEEALEEARRRQQEAVDALTDTEARRDPVQQYRDQVTQMLETARTFASDVQALADQGLNAKSLLELMTAGPEGSADARKALLSDSTLIDLTNEVEKEMDNLGGIMSTAAQTAQAALQAGGEEAGQYVGLGIRAQLEADAHDTIASLANALGASEYEVGQAGRVLGLAFMTAFQGQLSTPTPLSPTGVEDWNRFRKPEFKDGGVFGVMPGYTPGRDIYTIRVGGGESIMRPEFTSAVGPGWVNTMNRIARTSGASGVLAAMSRYLGGYANGGTVPQVVTVPVTSTHERYSPISIGTVVAADVADFQRQALAARRYNNTFGGTRGR